MGGHIQPAEFIQLFGFKNYCDTNSASSSATHYDFSFRGPLCPGSCCRCPSCCCCPTSCRCCCSGCCCKRRTKTSTASPSSPTTTSCCRCRCCCTTIILQFLFFQLISYQPVWRWKSPLCET